MIIKELKKEIIYILALGSIFFFLILNSDVEINSEDSRIPSTKIEDSIPPICDGMSYNTLKKLSYEDINNIEINIADSNAWYKNLFQAFTEDKSIKDRHKNYFYGSLVVNYLDDINCEFEIEARISGDWHDHIDINNFISSLDVKIVNGNLFGITKFKLFLPDTRGNDNEIYITTILDNLGYLVPRTFYVNAKFNNLIEQKFIFQEKFNKEFLEYNSLREGPIVETDETYFWNTSTGNPFQEGEYGKSYILSFGKIRNSNWSQKTKQNEIISLRALTLYNNAINSNIVDGYMFSDLNNFEEISTFEAFVTALQASHMLTNHNRVFYYNRLEDNFVPIYYDGSSNFLDTPNLWLQLNFDYPGLINGVFKAIEILQSKPLDSKKIQKELSAKGLDIDLVNIKILNEKLLNNLERIKGQNFVIPKNYPNRDEIIKNFKQKGISFTTDSNWDLKFNSRLLASVDRGAKFILLDESSDYKICNQKLEDCNKPYTATENIFTEKLEKNHHIYGLVQINNSNKGIKVYDDRNLKIKTLNSPKLEIDNQIKKITIIFSDPSQKVIFLKDSLINDYTIDVLSNEENITESRADEYLLTGCVTFYEVKFSNSSIYMDGSHCEDSINIIKSEGVIKEIIIKSSDQDALDIDFSNLEVVQLQVFNAGNDCLDLSSSLFKSNNIILNSCNDKAVSIGENSSVEINSLSVNNSNTGIAVKDMSYLNVNFAEIFNSNICAAIYQKKQEFGPAFLESSNFNCSSDEYFVQEGSLFEIRK